MAASAWELHESTGAASLNQEQSVSFLIIATLLSSIVVCTFVGNLFVIVAILVDKNLQNSANQLVLSLAAADLMVACLVMPLGAYNDIHQGWYLGQNLCEFWTSADVLCCTASILNLLAIALDRYWAVTNVDYIYKRTRRRVSVMILCAWTVGAVVSLAPIFGWKDPDFARRVVEDHKCLVSQDVSYQIFATISTFYSPLVLLLALYWRIFQVARKRIHCKPGGKPLPASTGSAIKQQQPEVSSPMAAPSISVIALPAAELPQADDDNQRQVSAMGEEFIADKLEARQVARITATGSTMNNVKTTRKELSLGLGDGDGEREKLSGANNASNEATQTHAHLRRQRRPASLDLTLAAPLELKSEQTTTTSRGDDVEAYGVDEHDIGHTVEASSCECACCCCGCPTATTTTTTTAENELHVQQPSSCWHADKINHGDGSLECADRDDAANFHHQPPTTEAQVCNNYHHKRPHNHHHHRHRGRGRHHHKRRRGRDGDELQPQRDKILALKREIFTHRRRANSCSSASMSSVSISSPLSMLSSCASSSSSSSIRSMLQAAAQAELDTSQGFLEQQRAFELSTAAAAAKLTTLAQPEVPKQSLSSVMEPLSVTAAEQSNQCLDKSERIISSNEMSRSCHNERAQISTTSKSQDTAEQRQQPRGRLLDTSLKENPTAALINGTQNQVGVAGGGGGGGQMRALNLKRRFRALGQLVSFVQTSRQFNSSSSAPTSQSGDDDTSGSDSSTSGDEGQEETTNDGRVRQFVRPCKSATGDFTRHTPALATSNGTIKSDARPAQAQPGGGVAHARTAQTTTTTCPLAAAASAVVVVAKRQVTPVQVAVNGQAGERQRTRRQNMEMKREKKAAKTLAIITGVFVCCWLPFFLNAILMSVCGLACTPSDLIQSVLLWLGYLNSMLNPIIYTIFSPDFRRAFRRLLCWPRTSTSGALGAPRGKRRSQHRIP